MKTLETPVKPSKLRGQTSNAKLAADLTGIARATAKLWRKHHLDYDATKHVVERVRRELGLKPPAQRRRTVKRLDRDQIEALIASAYKRSSRYGLMVKTLFYTGARVSEFVNISVGDLHLGLEPPQIYLAHAKMGSDGFVPILPALAQELRTHLSNRKSGYLFESRRFDRYTPRMVQLIVSQAARGAGIGASVTPHRLRASVATLLLDAGMPLDQVQKFLRHKRIATTQIYAETSLVNLGANYIAAMKR